MPHPLFYPLDSKDSSLLATAMLFENRDASKLLAHLPQPIAERLERRQDDIQGLERDARVKLLSSHLREQLKTSSGRGLELVDPSWVATELMKCPPPICGAILLTLSPRFMNSVVKRLSNELKQQLPNKQHLEALPEELKRSLRIEFERRFPSFPPASSETSFRFPDVLTLNRDVLHQAVKSIALMELGLALVAVGKDALANFCRRLSKQDTTQMLQYVSAFPHADEIESKVARRFLSKIATNIDDKSTLMEMAALWRLAKASKTEERAFADRFMYRVPLPSGTKYRELVELADQIEPLTNELALKTQDSILIALYCTSKALPNEPALLKLRPVFQDETNLDKLRSLVKTMKKIDA